MYYVPIVIGYYITMKTTEYYNWKYISYFQKHGGLFHINYNILEIYFQNMTPSKKRTSYIEKKFLENFVEMSMFVK
jgi:hypothetical protein